LVNTDKIIAMQARLTRQLFSTNKISLVTGVILAAILANIQRAVIEHAVIFTWLALVVLVTLFRTAFAIAYPKAAIGDGAASHFWLGGFRLGVLLSGFVWGSAGILLFPADNPMHQTFLIFVLAGLTAGGLVSYAADLFSATVFNVSALAPLIMRLFIAGDRLSLAMSMALLLYLGFVIISLRYVYRNVSENVALHLESEEREKALRTLLESNMDDLVAAKGVISHIMRSEGLSDAQIRYFQRPASQFNGDIIAVARDDNNDLHIMLADVTGHGLQAALFLLPISRAFYSMVKKGCPTSDIARELNKTMREIAVTGKFIAAAVAHIRRDGSSVEIWNGGIPTAVFVQKNGELHKFRSQHLPLGILDAGAFDAATEFVNTQPGAFFLCSDGLAEAENASGEPFGEERLESILQSSHPDEIYDNILSALEAHLEGAIAHDDLSMVIALAEPHA
jgi:prepilin signal peptidase PulO-like enzyme (type II secretory pathway)